MSIKISRPLWQSIGLGILSGMRSTAAPAIASHILSHHRSKRLSNSPLSFMQSKGVSIGLKVMALGELVGDKLPDTPNRTKPLGVVFRCLSGALAGASIFKASGNNALTGALAGSVAALGATYGSFLLRKKVVAELDVWDPIVGAVEDALVIVAGVSLAANA